MKKRVYLFLLILVPLFIVLTWFIIARVRSVKLYFFEPYVYDAKYDSEGYDESYTNSNGTVYLHDLIVPYINIDSDDAKKSNEEIEKLYTGILSVYKSNKNSMRPRDLSVNYKSYRTDNVLSVVITYKGYISNDYEYYMTFNFDLRDGHLLTYKEAYERFGYDSNSIREKIDLIIRDKFKGYLKDYSIETSSYDNDLEKNNKIDFYINGNDFNVCVWLFSQNFMFNVNEEISYVESIDADQKAINDIIKNELYVLGGKKSFNELSNKEKLWFSFHSFFGFSKDSFKGADLVKQFKDTSIGNLDITLDDIGYYSGNCITYEYNCETDTYNKTPNCAHSTSFVSFIYVDVSDYKIIDGKYNVSAKYLWYYDDMGFHGNIYHSYEDALNHVNPIEYSRKKFEELTYDDIRPLINNYTLETYNFTFEKSNDGFILVDFNVESRK